MAILKIARMGHPILRERAAPVSDPAAPEIASLIDDMVETMRDAGGTGLAAPQVHVPLRIVVYFVDGARNNGESVPLTVLINPILEPLGEDREYGWEGCLSVPGLTGLVGRAKRLKWSALAPDGSPIGGIASGFHARVLQHECDHLDGILYPARMDHPEFLLFVDELRKYGMLENARALMPALETERNGDD